MIKKTYHTHFIYSIAATMMLVALANLPSASADENEKQHILSSPLVLFQSIISKADGQRCPMFPSCSRYAAEAVEKHGKIKGLLLTGDRLLRCGHDETRLSPQVLVNGAPHTYDPVDGNTFWWQRSSGK